MKCLLILLMVIVTVFATDKTVVGKKASNQKR